MREHDISGLSVVVTAHDIEQGVAGSCKRCPVALAIRRTYPWLYPVVRTLALAAANFNANEVVTACHSRAASLFIAAFDGDLPSNSQIDEYQTLINTETGLFIPQLFCWRLFRPIDPIPGEEAILSENS